MKKCLTRVQASLNTLVCVIHAGTQMCILCGFTASSAVGAAEEAYSSPPGAEATL